MDFVAIQLRCPLRSIRIEVAIQRMKIDAVTPSAMVEPVGPYSHVTKADPFITTSGTPDIDPVTLSTQT